MTRIENAQKIVAPSFAPRFTVLGTDKDGRTYYALSPSIHDREIALDFLAIASSDKNLKLKKCRSPSEEQRQELRDWSWFIAVWGRKPEVLGASSERMAVGDTFSDDENEDSNMRWWGFWGVNEINKLAEWIAIQSGLDEDDETIDRATPVGTSSTASKLAVKKGDPKTESMKKLVRGLKEYATLLEWRTKEDKYIKKT